MTARVFFLFILSVTWTRTAVCWVWGKNISKVLSFFCKVHVYRCPKSDWENAIKCYLPKKSLLFMGGFWLRSWSGESIWPSLQLCAGVLPQQLSGVSRVCMKRQSTSQLPCCQWNTNSSANQLPSSFLRCLLSLDGLYVGFSWSLCVINSD